MLQIAALMAVLLWGSAALPALATTSSDAMAAGTVNLSFTDSDVRSVFTALADLGGLNPIIDQSVKGIVSITLKDAPLREAIGMVARAAGVSASISGHTLLVGSAQTAGVSTMEEMDTRVYALQYAEPAKVMEAAAMISANLKLVADDKGKRVVARGTASDLAALERFLAQFDKPSQQVLIEARVQEVSREGMKSLGIDWTLPTFSLKQDENTHIYTTSMTDLAMSLDALETTGEARLLAKPHIMAVSGEKATIFVGDRVPVILKGGSEGADKIEYIEAGITLEITPRISSDGTITAQVKPQVASIVSWTPQNLPQVRSRNAETTVQVRDGQPIIIGGLIREEEKQSMSGLPGLANLPVLGSLFRWNRGDQSQVETLVILTPHLVRDDVATAEAEAAMQKSQVSAATKAKLDAYVAKSSEGLWRATASIAMSSAVDGKLGVQSTIGVANPNGNRLEGRVWRSWPLDTGDTLAVGGYWRADRHPFFWQLGADSLSRHNQGTMQWELHGSVGLSLTGFNGHVFIEPGLTLGYTVEPGAVPWGSGSVLMGWRL